MSNLQITSHHSQLCIVAPEKSEEVSSWKVTTKRGTQSGVGISVSGSGAWGNINGNMTFHIRSLDKSKTHDMMKKEYKIGGGVSAFFNWLGISANVEAHKEEIHEVFKELANSQTVDGGAHFDLNVSGQYPNVQVDASAYVLVLQIEDNSGNTYNMASSDDPASNTGAQDQNGNVLPSKDNQSTITL
jgi:hypothetical protein